MEVGCTWGPAGGARLQIDALHGAAEDARTEVLDDAISACDDVSDVDRKVDRLLEPVPPWVDDHLAIEVVELLLCCIRVAIVRLTLPAVGWQQWELRFVLRAGTKPSAYGRARWTLGR